MVVGEIGRDRLEYLYEMSYCEIALIIRGYRRRNVLQYQFQRMQVFASTFAFRDNKDQKKAEDMWPLYFDKYIDNIAPPITEIEKKELQALIDYTDQELAAGGKF